jgi:hypothetical protein
MTTPYDRAIEAAARAMCRELGIYPDQAFVRLDEHKRDAQPVPNWKYYTRLAARAVDAYESTMARRAIFQPAPDARDE